MRKQSEHKINGDITYRNEFKHLRKKIKFHVDAAYKNYVIAAESSIKENPTKFWTYINNNKGASSICKTMEYNGNEINEPVDILIAFADYSSTSFVPLSDFLENVGIKYSFSNNLAIHEFKVNDVIEALKKIKNKMTMAAFLLRGCAQILALPLTIIFNLI